jgi:hypothetical protein
VNSGLADLLLQYAAGEDGWRIAKESYGPLSPLQRLDRGADPRAWGRFDTYSGRTLYAAGTPGCAFDEILAPFRRLIGGRDPLSADAEALGMSVQEFLSEVDVEWATREHMHSGHVPASWRQSRRLYQLLMPVTGFWIVASDKEFLAAAATNLTEELASFGVAELTLGVLFGENRGVIVEISTWARQIVLGEGTAPWGLIYQSKHGGGDCYAYWMRRVDGGDTVELEAVQSLEGREITADDPALLDTAGRFGLSIW